MLTVPARPGQDNLVRFAVAVVLLATSAVPVFFGLRSVAPSPAAAIAGASLSPGASFEGSALTAGGTRSQCAIPSGPALHGSAPRCEASASKRAWSGSFTSMRPVFHTSAKMLAASPGASTGP